jgi:hypothetical protein
MREKGQGFTAMPVKVIVVNTRQKRVPVRVKRAKWQEFLSY